MTIKNVAINRDLPMLRQVFIIITIDMTRIVPDLIIKEWTSQLEANILKSAHNVVSRIISDYEWDWEPDYDTLMHASVLHEREIAKEEIEIIKLVIEDKDKFTTKWLNTNPKVKAIIGKRAPEELEKMEAIDLVSELFIRASNKQEKWKEQKRIYIILWFLIWLALFQLWGAVIWFIIWYMIRNYIDPIKILERQIKKNAHKFN